jgi:nucleoid DNA-binding protein
MQKRDFTKRYAQHIQSTSAEAADQVDRVVHDLLRRLRAGQPAEIPGLGTLLPAPLRQQAPRPTRTDKTSK